jgi:putative sterol carrier protein
MNPSTVFRLFVFVSNWDSEAKKVIASGNHIFQIDLDGEEKFYLESLDGKLFFKKGEHGNPSATIRTSKRILSGLIKGQLKSDTAFLERKFEIRGSIFDGAKFNRLVNIVIERRGGRFFGLLRRLL